MVKFRIATLMVGLWIAGFQSPSTRAATVIALAAPIVDIPRAVGPVQTAVLAGGCFWGSQGVFQHVRGVKKVIAGYAGGSRATAHYGIVGLGKSGHAESVKITFDPAEISYGEILHIAFSVVFDPTRVNGQGPDSGRQYRSVLFVANAAQKRIALAYLDQLNDSHIYSRPIATRVDPLKEFYPAEDYQQDFVIHHPGYFYVATVDLPKITHLRRTFPNFYEARAVAALN